MSAPSIQQVKDYAAKLAGSAKLASIDKKTLHRYCAPDGTPLYWRIRLKCNSTGDKWIRPFHWNGAAFENTEPPAPPEGKPLYGLERLTASPDARVIVTEGESCTDAMNQAFAKWQAHGLVAMTSGGAQSAGAADWQPLADRRVIVWPDNDEQGAKYAADVVEHLQGIAASVAVLDISRLNLPPKGDAVDWLQSGGNLDGWMILLDAARHQPENPASLETGQHKQSDNEVIRRLASLKPLEYDRARKEHAKALGVRPATLDTMVKGARNDTGEAGRVQFNEVEPYPHPIAPAQLLDEVSDTIRNFIVMDTEQAHAAALWVALTWFVDAVEVIPLAIIDAPEKACGKTQLLTVIGRMAYRPLSAASASASALFRAVELWKPTILIDEADTFFRDNTELQGMVNAGYERGGRVLRSEATGDTFEPRSFSVFSAKALAGIALEKHLPDTTMSRGVVFNLRRKLPHESVNRLRHAERGLFDALSEKLARFAEDYSQQVRQARPSLPDALSDREQDNWEPLFAVASCAGAEWLDRAKAAALQLSGSGEKTQSMGNELLADIQTVFEHKGVERIGTADLIAALIEDEECAWATYNRGKPLTPRQLAKQLLAYGITSKQWRPGKYENPVRGFELTQFTDAFMRYLGNLENLPLCVTKSTNPNKHVALTVTDDEICNVTKNLSVTDEPSNGAGCGGVTDKTAIFGGEDEIIIEQSSLRI